MKNPAILLLFSWLFSSMVFAQSAGNALDLDGDDDYAWAPANVSDFPEGTIELWFMSEDDNRVVLFNGGSGFPGSNFDRNVIAEHTEEVKVLCFGIYYLSWIWVQSKLEVEKGVWYHAACTWGPDGMKIYINGKLDAINGYDGSIGYYVYDLIGATSWATKFKGKIDELRLWNVARDSAQLNSTMYDTLSAEYISNPDHGLVAYYKFDAFEDLAIDQDGPDDFRDYSMIGNHADSRGDISLAPSGAFGPAGIETGDAIHNGPMLYQNYPNPFSKITIISFFNNGNTHVVLKIYNSIGEEVATLENARLRKGIHHYEWDASSQGSGVYYVKLTSGQNISTSKILLAR